MKIKKEIITENVKIALDEDIQGGDVTAALIEPYTLAEATLTSRDNAILCGTEWFNEVFNQLDDSIEIEWLAVDGDKIKPNQSICNLKGSAHTILTGERTAINFLQTLSSVSTSVSAFVTRINHTKTKILDTRKTIPGLRHAQKYAVTVGGGLNHRFGLYDEILIKENHITASGSLEKTITKAKEKKIPITIEVENLDQLEKALKTDIGRIILDNFTAPNIKKAVVMANGKTKIEASGNITVHNIHTIAGTGVDYISIGAITKNIQAIDFSMLINLIYIPR